MKKNFVRGLASLSSTLCSSSSSSSSSLLSLVLKYLLVIFLLIEHGGTDLEEINNDTINLLQRNLKYWRRIYDTYKDEINLGYCWADYLLGTNDIRSDFISNIIEKEFMQLENNMIEENCANDTNYCNKYSSYNNYSEYDVNNVNSSDEQDYNQNNITTVKNLNDILRLDIPKIYNSTQQVSMDQVDHLKNQSSNLKGKRSLRHNEQETIIEPYIKLGNSYQRNFFYLAPEVFTSLKKKLALVSERSLSLKEESDILKLLGFLTFYKLFHRDKIMIQEYSYLYDILRNQMLKINGNDINDREKETTTNRTIWSLLLFDDNKEDKVQVQDLISFRKNSKTRNKRFAKSILSIITENSIFTAVYWTLTGIFRAGQLIAEIVDSSNVLRCTKDYLLKRIIQYIDSL